MKQLTSEDKLNSQTIKSVKYVNSLLIISFYSEEYAVFKANNGWGGSNADISFYDEPLDQYELRDALLITFAEFLVMREEEQKVTEAHRESHERAEYERLAKKYGQS